MAEAEAGLELPIGLTEQKFLQQLARIEARAIKAANASEQAFVKANANIVKSTGAMSGQMRGQIQNVSYQLQDVFVQIAGGTSATRALSQQLPQLASGFGAVGAVIGTVLAVAIPFVASILNMEEEAIDLDKSIKSLVEGLEALREAQQNAAMPIDQLIEKYGALADEMGRVFQNHLAIARQELEAMGASIEKAIGATADLTDMVTRFDSLKQAVDAGVISYDEYIRLLRDLEQQFGFTAAQALQYQNLMDAVASAQGPEQHAQAWLAVHDWLEANRASLEAQGVAVDDMLRQTNELARGYGDAHKAASDATSAAEVGAIATDSWAAAAANLAANMDGAAAAAGRAAAAVGAAIAAQNKAAGLGGVGALDPFSASSGRALTAVAGGMNIPQQTDFDRQWQAQVKAQEEAANAAAREAARKPRSKGAKSGGRKGKDAYTSEDLMEAAQRDLTNLERQLELLGKNTEQAEALRAKWQLLDEAKRRGLTVDESLTAEIDRQSAAIGKMAVEYEKAAEAADFYADMNEQARDGFIDAIVEGESLAGVLGDVAKAFAKAALQAALFGKGPLSGGMGGLLSFLPGFSSGGFTGGAGRNQVTGVVHGGEYVMSAPAVQRIGLQNLEALHKGGSVGGQPKITINNNAPGAVVSADYVTKDEVILTVSQAIASNNRRQSDQQYLRGGR